MRLLHPDTKVRCALASRKCAMAHGAHQTRNAAIGSTTDQMNTEAALAVMRALWIGTVACRELHGFLLIRTVCHVSGVYSECSRSPFVFIHAIEGQHRSLEKLSTLRASRPLHWRHVRLLRSTKLVLIVRLTVDAAKRACTAASEPKMIFVVTSTTRPPFLRLT